jgi:hypothetical protein
MPRAGMRMGGDGEAAGGDTQQPRMDAVVESGGGWRCGCWLGGVAGWGRGPEGLGAGAEVRVDDGEKTRMLVPALE